MPGKPVRWWEVALAWLAAAWLVVEGGRLTSQDVVVAMVVAMLACLAALAILV